MRSIWAKLKYILFALYCITLLALLFFRNYDYGGAPYFAIIKQNTSLIPFRTITKFWKIFKDFGMNGMGRDAFRNLAGNLILFVPFGIMAPNLFGKLDRISGFFFITLFIILLVEIVQLFSLLGVFDVDDVILNLSGALFGFAIQKLTKCFIKIKRL